MTETADDNYLWDQRHVALYQARLSALYHQKRERFFDFLDKSAKAVSIFGGSAALARLSTNDGIVWIAAAITGASTLSLVIGFSDRARRHSELARSFRAIEADVLAKGERHFTEQDIADWRAKIATLEASEPAALSGLVVDCQNELATAAGQREKVVSLTLLQKLTKNFVDWSPAA